MRRNGISEYYNIEHEIQENNKSRCGWGMCIVNSEKLDVKYFTSVCLNQQDV